VSGLPIDALRPAFEAQTGTLVVSAPTGSGKSTQIPRWCAGPVLVVEPRRVACRSLAVRVAELESTRLGGTVGYRVRGDDRSSAKTRVLFATPGVVLRMLAGGATDAYATVVLDEFHERTLDVDLLLALLLKRGDRLIVMSATLDGDRVAEHVGGVHLHGEGRTFPVVSHYLAGDALLPDVRGLERRVCAAVDAAADDPGDILVFLPGKAEIASVSQALRGRDLAILPLHGGLSLDEQSRAFAPARRRKVICATNVAETSITLPGVGVVIDSGLVRRTRYHGGRGFLTLLPVASDSAEQRTGRAGRTASGVCYRLWSQAANLLPSTPPEIHRESLVPLVIAAAACGARPGDLPFLDPAKDHALAAATDELTALGALREDGLTDTGRELFGLPLDVPLGRLLVEARRTGALEDAVDLVSVLAVGRPLFAHGVSDEDLRVDGCDAVARILAVRIGDPTRHGLRRFTLDEARRVSARLRRAFNLPRRSDARAVDRRRLALTALAADPRCAHIARRRKRAIAWSNGGTEISLSRDSAVQRDIDDVDTVLVFETRAAGVGRHDTQILATCAMPVPTAWLLAAGVGRERVAGVVVKRDRVLARIERTYARRVLATREDVPHGALAREALTTAFLEGRVWKDTLAQTRERLEAAGLQARLDGEEPPPPLEAWVAARVDLLGVESGDDLALLSPDDLLAPDLPAHQRAQLDRTFPRRVELSDATYAVHYDLRKRLVTLEKLAGRRRDPPPRIWLPAFRGFRVEVKTGPVLHRYK